MKAPIVSRKHIVQHTITQVATGTVNTKNPIQGRAVQDVNTASEVIEGSVVKAVYMEYWVVGTFDIGSFVVIVEKAPAAIIMPSFTNMTTLDAYPNKKNILFTSQGLMAEADGNPTPVLRQWIKIPKGKQRFGLEDELRISFSSLGADDLQYCGFTLYKSYN